MKRLIVMGAVAALSCAVCVASARAQADRPDRSLRLDHDSMRNDYREDRLKIPTHPLLTEQPARPPETASKGKAKSKRGVESSR